MPDVLEALRYMVKNLDVLEPQAPSREEVAQMRLQVLEGDPVGGYVIARTQD